jgi:hypothetical protein
MSLPNRIWTAITPFGAFDLMGLGQTEEQVKQLFIHTATSISNKVRALLDDSFEQSHNLDNIMETLDRIKELCHDELGDLPTMNVLGALWASLVSPDEYETFKSHTTLLQDLFEFYTGASTVVEQTTGALNRIEAELNEFRDEYAMPGLILKDYPIEVIIELLRKAGQRLEDGGKALEFLEGGETQEKPIPATAYLSQ